MKKVFALFILLPVMSATFSSCKKTETSAEPVTAEQISTDISGAICEKMKLCDRECPENLSASITSALPEAAKSISMSTLKSCVTAITAADCSKLDSDTAPKGCEFMN